jgi:hypothetical protein
VNAAPGVSAVPPGTVHAHAELLARADLQFDFPALTPPPLPGWFLALLKWMGTIRLELRYAEWILLGCAAVLLIWFAGRKAWEYLRGRAADSLEVAEPAIDWRPASQAAKLLLNDADALAAAGRYGDAAHLLLLHGIQDIAERNPALLRPALTSREIGGLQQLPQIPRGAFMRIAQIVELPLFAERALTASDFMRCRSEYERFAFPAAWSPEAA